MRYGERQSSRLGASEAAALIDNAFDSAVNVSAKAQSADTRVLLQDHSNGEIAAPPIQMCAQPSAVLQAMEIRSAMDSYEREADSVSNEVVNAIHATSESRSETSRATIRPRLKVGGADIQRLSAAVSARDGGATSAEIQMARGGGSTIPDVDRKPMERSFGADFSGVRIHTDSRADALNKSLGALALTSGKDVFFKRGEYAPGNESGQKLLAHELTHVVQQNGGPGLHFSQTSSPVIQCKLAPIGHRAFDKAAAASGDYSWDEARAWLENHSIIPEALQNDICRFDGASESAENRLDYVRARLLRVYYHKYTYERTRNDEDEARRIAQNAVDNLKNLVVSWGITKDVTITPDLRQRLEGKDVVTAGMQMVEGPLVEVCATKIPPAREFEEASGANFHSYIRYSPGDGGEIKYIRAHANNEMKLEAIYGAYEEGVHEYDVRGSSKIVVEGDAAANKWGDLTAAADSLNKLSLNYQLLGPNCNTGARYILKKAGLGSHSPPNVGTFFGWYANTGHYRRERRRTGKTRLDRELL